MHECYYLKLEVGSEIFTPELAFSNAFYKIISAFVALKIYIELDIHELTNV
jgi:hypothetical protein